MGKNSPTLSTIMASKKIRKQRARGLDAWLKPYKRIPKSWMEPPKHPSGGNFVDLSIFEDDTKPEKECSVHGESDMVNSCKSLKRLSVALKYLKLLRYSGGNDVMYGLCIYRDFVENIYVQYVDDLAHLKMNHECDLDIIHQNLIENEGFEEFSCITDLNEGEFLSSSSSTDKSLETEKTSSSDPKVDEEEDE